MPFWRQQHVLFCLIYRQQTRIFFPPFEKHQNRNWTWLKLFFSLRSFFRVHHAMINFTPQLFGIKVAFLFCYSSEYDAMGKKSRVLVFNFVRAHKTLNSLELGMIVEEVEIVTLNFILLFTFVRVLIRNFSSIPSLVQQITCSS